MQNFTTKKKWLGHQRRMTLVVVLPWREPMSRWIESLLGLQLRQPHVLQLQKFWDDAASLKLRVYGENIAYPPWEVFYQRWKELPWFKKECGALEPWWEIFLLPREEGKGKEGMLGLDSSGVVPRSMASASSEKCKRSGGSPVLLRRELTPGSSGLRCT